MPETIASPPALDDDALLKCLVEFTRLFHRPVSSDALLAGLPVTPGSAVPELFSIDRPKSLFSRVAKRAGFASRLVRRRLEDFSELLLPCILVLKDREACILESIDRTQKRAKVILPDLSDGESWIPLEELEKQYLGFAFLLKREYQGESRSLSLFETKSGHWFWGTLGRCRSIYTAVIIGSVLINLFALAAPLFTMNVYDRVVPNDAIETLWVLAIGIGIVLVFDVILRSIRNHLLEVAGRKSDVIMSSLLFEQVMNLRLERWPGSVGAFSSKLTQFESIRQFFTAATMISLVDLPFSIVFLLVIAYIGDGLVAVPLVTMALLLSYGLLVSRALKKSIAGVLSASAMKNALLIESLTAIETIKTQGASRYAQWIWEETTGDIAARSQKMRGLSSSIGVVTSALVQANMVAIVVLGVYEIMDHTLSLGALIAVVLLSSRAIAPMSQIAGLITSFQQTKAAFESIDSLMREPVERRESDNFVRRPEFHGGLDIVDVDFRYPGAARTSLKELNLSIKPGERVGIIGRVGCGKSTLAKLLIGLYSPQEGAILVDGIDLNQIDPADLRHSIAYLSQDCELLRSTLRENIVLKDPKTRDERVLKAAYLGGVDLFTNTLPKGLDSQIGEHGQGLSGGQRQSVALARALLLDEPILILDEPTNAMDNLTESVVKERLKEYVQDKTLILITHKMSMLDLVDRLIVIESGTVVQDGPKEHVLKALQSRQRAA